MSSRNRTQAALRESLKQESQAIAEGLRTDGEAPAGGSAVAAQAGAAPIEASPPAIEVSTPSSQTTKDAKARKAAPASRTTRPKVKTADEKAATAKTARKTRPVAPVAQPVTEAKAPAPMKKARATNKGTAPKAVAEELGKAATAVAAPQEPVRKDKREKVVRDSFSMPASEHKKLKAIRESVGRIGRLATKSEVLRSALNLIATRTPAEIVSLMDALPAIPKGKHGKKG